MALLATFLAREGRLFLLEQRAELGGTAAGLLSPLAREVLAHLPDPLMLLDEGGRVLFANGAMQTVIGIGPENKHISLLLRTPAVLEAVSHTTASGEDSSVEFIIPVPVERHYQAYVRRLSSQPPVTTLLLHDLTAAKRTEQMRADFVANASHELRTPLAAVSGFIDTLKGHARDDAQARDRLPRHHERGGRADAPADRGSSLADPGSSSMSMSAPPAASRWRPSCAKPSPP
ncbi:MAG: histidine kinase dimerization/phospho-acceptor domain-containing protein [Rhizomicrobium sp.]